MKKRKNIENIVLAFLSAFLYLGLRFIMHEKIGGAGYFDGGLVSDDSYYHYAFAKELIRTGHLFLFQNPFGSFDKEPHLINIYASFLKILSPFYRIDLFLFDCILGAVVIFLTSLCLMILLSRLQTIDKALLLFGGGVSFIGVFFGVVSEADAIGDGFWGLTYFLNQISTPEIIYHFLFFFGLFCLIKGHDLGVILVMAILTFLHPFTSITFNALVISAWLYQLIRSRRFVNSRLKLFLYAVGSITISVLVFQIFLPYVSRDAKYFKLVYEKTNFQIDFRHYSLFFIIPMLFCLASLLFTKKSEEEQDGELLWVSLMTSIFCMAMSMSYLITSKIIQPAHWSRAYPYVLLIAFGGLYSIRGVGGKPSKILKLIKICLLIIAISDSALGIKYISGSLFHEKRPPLFLTLDQIQIIKLAKNLKPGTFLYLRDKSNKTRVGDFEYAIMAMSPQKGLLGHSFFSPFLQILKPRMYPKGTKISLPKPVISYTDYFIFDKQLLNVPGFQLGDTLYEGTSLVFTKNAKDK